MSRLRWSQAGFTLMELLVVLVIVAVVLSAGLLSFRQDTSRYVAQQANQIQGLLQAGCDEAVWGQRLVFFEVSEKGLQPWVHRQGRWQVFTDLKPLAWHPSVQVDWTLPALSGGAYDLPAEGWLCWPSGDLTAGEMRLNQHRLIWDEGGVFVFGEADE
ncbi:MAG: prepilin-type N-terminal cleavage/methylation domain-containing protein [Thiomicrospira sp.]|nr:prepilin-type N-terminal cleavage/methylation domain-containing protein [Thiomicrospira sp.]